MSHLEGIWEDESGVLHEGLMEELDEQDYPCSALFRGINLRNKNAMGGSSQEIPFKVYYDGVKFKAVYP